MNKKWWIFALAVAALAAGYAMLLPVDETTYVLITRFGRVIGHPVHEPGLHFKLPWDTCIVLDKRLQIFDPRPSEFLLASKPADGEEQGIGQNVVVDYFVTWRILGVHAGEMAEVGGDARNDGPLLFLKSVNNPRNAQAKLLEIIHSALSATLGRRDMSALVSVNDGEVRLPEIEHEVTVACREIALRDFGIEIEDIRIKRVGLPEQNKQSVFERMRAERMRKARQLRAEGERDATIIQAEADKEASAVLAVAYKESEEIRGEGDAKATAIYAAAHNQDPDFYRLVRTLDAYRKFLDSGTTLVLSADSELLQLLAGPKALVLQNKVPDREGTSDTETTTQDSGSTAPIRVGGQVPMEKRSGELETTPIEPEIHAPAPGTFFEENAP